MKKPELLAPAGDLERLKTVINYGADAVYMGGESYGLRAKAKNFTLEEMKEGVSYAHKRGVKVYITANIFAHNGDLEGMGKYFKELEEMGVDGVLVSDPGVFSLVREAAPALPVHISTQANNTNYRTAEFWKSLGAKRIVAARELSVREIKEITSKTDIEVEAFVHGAMCISYSGRCLLSAYFTGRDANKGACTHPCRWKYYITEETRPGEYMPINEDGRGTYIFNSKDLCMIEHIPELVESGIVSFKLEGRIKTAYYGAVVVKAYREAIDDYFRDKALYERKKEYYLEELKKASYRGFTTGFYFGKPDKESQIYINSAYIKNYDFIGVVREYEAESGIALIEQRNKFSVGDKVEFLRAGAENFSLKIDKIVDLEGNERESAPHAQELVKIRVGREVKPMDIMRKEAGGNDI
ncbi:MAG: U32 family peptidase [Clostridiales bacterium]|nr:U32 family peptidase [Clostridiales bacterium]